MVTCKGTYWLVGSVLEVIIQELLVHVLNSVDLQIEISLFS